VNGEPEAERTQSAPETTPATAPAAAPTVGHFARAARPSPLEDTRVRAGVIVVVALLAAAAIAALAALAAARAARSERDALAAELETLKAESAEVTATRMRAEAAEARVEVLDGRVRRLLAPAAGLPTVALTPVAEGDGDPAEIRLAPEREPFALLRLATGRTTAVSGLRVRLRDRDGGEIWAAEGVASDAEGVVTVLVPSMLLAPGLIGVELEGPVTARYRLRVVADAG
jgi:hypothetical protein